MQTDRDHKFINGWMCALNGYTAGHFCLVFLLLFITMPVLTQSIHIEAEDGELEQVTVSTNGSGFSGSGFVTGFTNDQGQVVFRFPAESGLYNLSIGFATPNGSKGYDLEVNGKKSTGQFPATQQFKTHDAGKFNLNSGTNTIRIGKGWGWYHLDFIRLEPATISLPQKPPHTLLDTKATGSTKALFAWLISLYGEKMLSGQQSMDDIEYIETLTGKSPAIGVFDLIDYSPSRVEHGADPTGSVETWINWARANNGIVSLSWHWNAPMDLIDLPGQEWWRGFYTNATTFDLEAALANKNGIRYQLLLRDMDLIAVQLKKFQTLDIPVLWRPLHEVWGRWFWWGAKGPEPFIELWRLMVDRFTSHHELHNLIWVYTHQDMEWYPGDDVVDVVSMDIYTEQSSTMSGEWESTQQDFDGQKLVALSESGTLPEPDEVRTFGTWWSWFSTWSGDFIRSADTGLVREVFLDEDVLTLDELPDWRDFGQEAQNGIGADESGIQIFPNPSRGTATLLLDLAETTDVTITIYNVLGKIVYSRFYPLLTAESNLGSLQAINLASGVYLIRAGIGTRIVHKKFTVIP